MTAHQVRELSLLLRTTGQPGPTVRPRAEKFVAEVLEQLGDCFELRFPGRIILIRTLPIHWQLSDKQLDSPTELADAVDQVASSIDAEVWPILTPPPKEEEVIVFSDEAQWRACFAVAVSFGIRAEAWYFKSLNADSEPWSFLTRTETPNAANAQLLRQVLQHLAAEDLLTQVLGESTKSDLELIAGVLGLASSGFNAKPILSASDYYDDDAMLQKTIEPKNEVLLKGLTPRLRLIQWIIQHVGSIASIDDASISLSRSTTASSQLLQDEPTWQPVREGTQSREATRIHPSDEPTISDELDEEKSFTQFAGLFYLLRIALELEIGEILWKACLPEGAILSEAAELILGEMGKTDPAIQLFGGCTTAVSSWNLSAEQHSEVCLALLDSFVLAIPRRGLAEWPATRLAMVNSPARKLLTVVSDDQLLFAWPVATANDLQQGLVHFLSRWPMSATAPESTPDLAMLDDSGRIRSTSRKDEETPLHSKVETLADALVAQVAGTMCRLFSARLHGETSNSQIVPDFLKQRGTIQRSNGELSIILPMSSINLDVRKAGLDQDPGWIPWLDATVKFEFLQDSLSEG